MEIERKFLVKKENLPENLEQYPCKVIEQGYLCTEPVVRIRKSNDNYYLTYKSKGLLAREEYNLPLTKEAYEHLKLKADGIVISKVRYVIPEKDGLSIELDGPCTSITAVPYTLSSYLLRAVNENSPVTSVTSRSNPSVFFVSPRTSSG